MTSARQLYDPLQRLLSRYALDTRVLRMQVLLHSLTDWLLLLPGKWDCTDSDNETGLFLPVIIVCQALHARAHSLPPAPLWASTIFLSSVLASETQETLRGNDVSPLGTHILVGKATSHVEWKRAPFSRVRETFSAAGLCRRSPSMCLQTTVIGKCSLVFCTKEISFLGYFHPMFPHLPGCVSACVWVFTECEIILAKINIIVEREGCTRRPTETHD